MADETHQDQEKAVRDRHLGPRALSPSDIAYWSGLGASLLLLALFGPLERKLAMVGRDDFSKIWAGPRALVTGHDPYDPSTWHETALALGTFPPDTTVYLYPPWVALILAPLALPPLAVASMLWTIGGLAAAVIALRALMREFLPDRPLIHATAAVTLVLSGPAISALLTGQWSFVLVAALSGIVLFLRSERPVFAGLSSLAMLMKPQLFLYAAPALGLAALWPGRTTLEALDRRFVTVAAGTALLVVAASWLVLPSWWPTWLVRVGDSQLVPESVTIPGLLFRTFGPVGLLIAPAVLLLGVAIALQFHPRSEAWLPVWLALSIAATPYSNAYDLLLLIVPLVVAAGVLSIRSRRKGDLLFFSGAAVLLIFASLLHDLGLLRYAPLVPASVLALIVASLWGQRRRAGETMA